MEWVITVVLFVGVAVGFLLGWKQREDTIPEDMVSELKIRRVKKKIDKYEKRRMDLIKVKIEQENHNNI